MQLYLLMKGVVCFYGYPAIAVLAVHVALPDQFISYKASCFQVNYTLLFNFCE